LTSECCRIAAPQRRTCPTFDVKGKHHKQRPDADRNGNAPTSVPSRANVATARAITGAKAGRISEPINPECLDRPDNPFGGRGAHRDQFYTEATLYCNLDALLNDRENQMRSFLAGILVFSGTFADPLYAAQRDLGALTCSQQRDSCINYRRTRGPFGSEGLCVTVYNECNRTGVWDATGVFPYGGVRIRGMIRDAPASEPKPKKVAAPPRPQETGFPGNYPIVLRQEGERHCEPGVGGVVICMRWNK
jgi:hypothetical protein